MDSIPHLVFLSFISTDATELASRGIVGDCAG